MLREQMYLETDKPMKPGKMFSVRLKFEYGLARGLEGFYLSSYKVRAGLTRPLKGYIVEKDMIHEFYPSLTSDLQQQNQIL